MLCKDSIFTIVDKHTLWFAVAIDFLNVLISVTIRKEIPKQFVYTWDT
jgi:hypothetical protein